MKLELTEREVESLMQLFVTSAVYSLKSASDIEYMADLGSIYSKTKAIQDEIRRRDDF